MVVARARLGTLLHAVVDGGIEEINLFIVLVENSVKLFLKAVFTVIASGQL